MSDRLRGESASPADLQNTGSTIEEGTDPPGAETTGTLATASPSSHPPGRKKGTGGKKGTALQKQSGPATTTSGGPGTAPASSSTPTGDQEERVDGDTATKELGAEGLTEPIAPKGPSTTRQSRRQPEATQSLAQPDQDGNFPSQRGATQATEGCGPAPSGLIAPEMIGRIMTGRNNRKPIKCDPSA